MAINILDAQDAWLSGKADFEEWQDEFEAEWSGPLGKMLVSMLWSRLSPEEHMALRLMNPEAHDAVGMMIGGMQHGEELV